MSRTSAKHSYHSRNRISFCITHLFLFTLICHHEAKNRISITHEVLNSIQRSSLCCSIHPYNFVLITQKSVNSFHSLSHYLPPNVSWFGVVTLSVQIFLPSPKRLLLLCQISIHFPHQYMHAAISFTSTRMQPNPSLAHTRSHMSFFST